MPLKKFCKENFNNDLILFYSLKFLWFGPQYQLFSYAYAIVNILYSIVYKAILCIDLYGHFSAIKLRSCY